MPTDQDASRADYRCKSCGKSYKSYEELEAHEPDCLRAATAASSEPEKETTARTP
jgi:transposase-like protein